jgi:hypothetical protein
MMSQCPSGGRRRALPGRSGLLGPETRAVVRAGLHEVTRPALIREVFAVQGDDPRSCPRHERTEDPRCDSRVGGESGSTDADTREGMGSVELDRPPYQAGGQSPAEGDGRAEVRDQGLVGPRFAGECGQSAKENARISSRGQEGRG